MRRRVDEPGAIGAATLGKNAFGPAVAARYPDGLVNQGIAAEIIAARWKLGRAAMDEYSARSHARAAATAESGGFANEIVLVTVAGPDGEEHTVSIDETARAGTTVALDRRRRGVGAGGRLRTRAQRGPHRGRARREVRAARSQAKPKWGSRRVAAVAEDPAVSDRDGGRADRRPDHRGACAPSRPCQPDSPNRVKRWPEPGSWPHGSPPTVRSRYG